MMNVMSGSAPFSLEKFISGPIGRVGLVLLTSMVSAGSLGILIGFDVGIHINILFGLLLTGLGFVAGFSSRLLLYRNTRTLQLFTALVGALMGLVVFGLISRGVLGLDLAARDKNSTLYTVLQVFWSGTAAWLAVRAWNRPAKKKTVPVREPVDKRPYKQSERKPNPGPAALKKGSGKSRKPQMTNPFPGLLQRIDFKNRLKEGRERLFSIVDLTWGKRFNVGKGVRIGSSKPLLRVHRPKFSQRKVKIVKLVGAEEHNCPYCLEVVTRKDPRGLKICSTCKTWHHADCWAEAGECQVPHQHDY
jgi:hypothetical protein